MKDFVLHPRLAADCFVLGQFDFSLLLLMNNSLVPWFILVPRTSVQELFELDDNDLATLLVEIKTVSDYVKQNFNVSKLNVAAIGNVVSQLHVHIVGRDPSDYCWPGVVWGAEGKKEYSENQVKEICTALSANLGGKFMKMFP
ncbi:MAG: HIT domain-containing protein [Deltaproteobacteria bacterium]|nr:HIT domain-containing protein [Deltaproteobacteria bacterium]